MIGTRLGLAALLGAIVGGCGGPPVRQASRGETVVNGQTSAAAPGPIVRDAPPHPLDPLSAAEIEVAAAALAGAGHLHAGALLPLLVLHEPPKEEVLAFAPGAPVRREALALVLDRADNRTGEAVVDLAARRVVSWRELPGAQPNLTATEFERVPELVRADPRWQEAMRKRGISDLEGVHLDVWAPGRLSAEEERRGARLARALAFWRGETRTPYLRPIEGVVAVVDLNADAVVSVEDTGAVPVPPASHDLDPRSIGVQRPAPRPLRVLQPEGPSFELRGQEVAWQGWRFRWALHPREGLVLYQVAFEDGGRARSILYRGALSEIVVPYGDPDPAWAWRGAFDEGEYGLGRHTFPQELGSDVPENAVLLPAVLADDRGAPQLVERAVALYERDGGLLWRHLDEEAGHLEARRARELVLRNTVTIGNYDYGFSWVFGQDGALSLEVELTGLLLARGVGAPRCAYCPDLAQGASPGPEAADTRFGTLVAPGVLAPNHQHFFCARLDLDVDGPANSVLETQVAPALAGSGDEAGAAFVVERRLLEREGHARRETAATLGRRWKVFNPAKPGPLGHLPAFVLVPGETAAPMPHPDAAVRRRAGFLERPLWVTRHRRGELYASGDHPNQARVPDGVARYAADDEPLVAEDVVVWYTFGVSHAPRVEEWPVMSVHRIGFRLVPHGFFERNPALDVPPLAGH